MEEVSRRGSMFLSKDQRGSMLIDASRRRTISRQNEGPVLQFYVRFESFE